MSGTGFEIKDLTGKDIIKAQSGYSTIGRIVLFIIPSLVITIISVILFYQLRGLTETEMNVFSITIIAAVILSLIGMAGMQSLIYRIADDREYFSDGATMRATRIGILYSLLFSLIVSIVLYPFFSSTLDFSLKEYSLFVLLLLMYSGIWVLSSALWASEKYAQPAIIFSISYLATLGLTLYAYNMQHEYAIIGYSLGTAILFTLLLIVSAMLFPKPKTYPKISRDLSKILSLASRNGAAVSFGIFYVIAIFLDKIIIWTYQGITSGQGLLVNGTYNTGAFLGLVPMFSIAIMVYFTKRTRQLNDERYNGTLREIQKRIRDYKAIYWFSIGATLLLAFGLFVLTASLSLYYFSDGEIIKILVTVSLGSIFLSIVVFNSAVLPIFGKSSASALAVFIVIIFEILTVPFVGFDVWFASLGFLLGSFAGFLISMASTIRMLHSFEFNLFRYLLNSN